MANENFPINVQSINFPDCRTDLDDFVANLPDASKWSQFFESATGQLISDLVASMSALLKYETTVARREAYIQFSQNRSSKIGSSQFLGYSTFRGKNAVVELTFTPAGTGIYDRFDIIGNVKDRDLILLESYAYNAGVPLTVQCAIGAVDEQIILAQDSTLAVFKYTTKNVSEEVRIFIDSVEVEHSDSVTDMLNGQFQLQSNVFGSVDAKYLNLASFANQYVTGSEIKLQWIDLQNIEWAEANVQLDEAEGVLTDVVTITLFQDVETNISIEVNAPITNETKLHVRARRDQAKIFKQLDPSIVDAEGDDISAAVMKIIYIRTNDFRFTPAEIADLQAIFEDFRPYGLLPPGIEAGSRAPLKLKFTIYREPNTTGDSVAKIEEIVTANEFILGHTLNLHDIEQELEAENYIKVARVEYDADLWTGATPYELGQQVLITPSLGLLYQVIGFIYKSGLVIPTFPVVNGALVIDGQVVWETFIKSDDTSILDWAASTKYVIGNEVKPLAPNGFAYRVKRYLHISGGVEPVWTPMAGATPEEFAGTIFKSDGNLMWIARVETGTPATWASDSEYLVGQEVIGTDQVASDNEGIMWQCYGFVKPSGASQPPFTATIGQSYDDGEVTWQGKTPDDFEVELGSNQYYVIEKDVTVNL